MTWIDNHLPIVVGGIIEGDLDVIEMRDDSGCVGCSLITRRPWVRPHYQAVLGRVIPGQTGRALAALSLAATGYHKYLTPTQRTDLQTLVAVHDVTYDKKLMRVLSQGKRPVTSAALDGPPRTPHILMYWLLPRATRNELIGDALELYNEKILPTFGPRAAKQWFWWEAVRSIAVMLPWRILKAVTMGWLVQWVSRLTK